MSLLALIKKKHKLIRLVYIGICLIGMIVAIYFGYQFFHNRLVLFVVFIGYILIMTGVAIWFGLHILAMLLL